MYDWAKKEKTDGGGGKFGGGLSWLICDGGVLFGHRGNGG